MRLLFMSCSFTLMNLEPNLRSRFTTNHSNTWLTTLATLKTSACHVGLQLLSLDYAAQCVQAYCTGTLTPAGCDMMENCCDLMEN